MSPLPILTDIGGEIEVLNDFGGIQGYDRSHGFSRHSVLTVRLPVLPTIYVSGWMQGQTVAGNSLFAAASFLRGDIVTFNVCAED